MDPLEYELVRIVAQIEDPFHAHDIGTEFGKELSEPAAQLNAVERARHDDRCCRNVIRKLVIVIVFLSFDFDVEASEIQNLGNLDFRISGLVNTGSAVQDTDLIFQLLQVFRIDQIHFVEQDKIGKSYLLARLGRMIDLLPDVFGIDDGDDAVQLEFAADPFVDEKCLYH